MLRTVSRKKAKGTGKKVAQHRKQASEKWERHCSGCAVPGVERKRATIACVNCGISFCDVTCFREFHELGA